MINYEGELDEQLVEKLNDLIEIAYDGHNGYQTAAEHAENEAYAELFEEFAAQREEHARELTDLINEVGGDPEAEGRISGAFHRAWIDIKSVITDGDEAVLAECVRGEEEALESYSNAISMEMPEEIREVLRQQLSDIRIAYERVNELESALRA